MLTYFRFSQYSSGLQENNRINLDFSYRGHNLKRIDVVLNQVRSDSVFQEADINIKLLDGRIQPYMKYSHEYRENSYRFDDSVLGLVYKEKTREFSIGLGNREDQQMMAINSQGMKRVMSGKFTQIDFKMQREFLMHASYLFFLAAKRWSASGLLFCGKHSRSFR